MKARILLVEDEESIRVMLSYNLEKSSFSVKEATTGEDALALAEEMKPDLIILDWMIPPPDGAEVCKRLRGNESTRSIPIIMLTARVGEDDRVHGLDCGADDYVVKPFSPAELIARINAILRRTRPMLTEKMAEFEGIKMDLTSHKALVDGQPVRLGPTEFRLLCHFVESPGRIFSREQLLDAVWGQDVYVELRTVDVHIRRLRKTLDEQKPGLGDLIKTVRSAGYIMEK